MTLELGMGNNFFVELVGGLVGIALLVIGAFRQEKSSKSIIVSLMGIPGVSANVPDKAVGKPYSLYNPQTFKFTLDLNNPAEMVDKLDVYYRNLVHEQVINDARRKAFFAGLARVPCLFAMGTIFRSSGVEVEPLERFRNPDKWSRLGRFKETPNEYHIKGNPKNLVTSGKEIGIAVSLTGEVLAEELPEEIRNHCITINLDPVTRREAVATLHELHEFSKKFKEQLDQCSKVADVIHLFICAQSSVVFEMGRAYQEGMHKKLVVHNFVPGEGYCWSIEIDKGAFKYKERKTLGSE